MEDVHSIPKLDYYMRRHFRTLGKALKVAGLPIMYIPTAYEYNLE